VKNNSKLFEEDLLMRFYLKFLNKNIKIPKAPANAIKA
jgi:hypothetical protein